MLTADWVTYGGGATERLRAAIAGAQGTDPLQPVTVVTPSPSAAIVLRRQLGRRGMAAVTFLALEQLAELIAARPLARAGRPVIVPELVTAAVRTVLHDHDGQLAGVAAHPATEQRLAEVVLDLSLVPEADRRGLPDRLEGLAAEVAGLAVRALDALAGHALDADLFASATSEIRRRPELAAPLGPVIVHLPARLPSPAAGLVRALAAVTDVTVLVGQTGVAAADEPSHAALAAIGCAAPLSPGASPPTPTRVIAANDVDDEVRTVVRHLMALVDGGTPVHRMAVLYGAADPYARTITDQLRAAGVPFSSPSTDTLATTVAGRTLLGAIDAVGRGCERDAVIDLVGQGPVLAADGELAPVSRWDRISRRAGVIAGPDQWRRRLNGHAEWRLRQAGDASGEVDLSQWYRQQAEEAGRLAEFVEHLVHLASEPPRSWNEVAPWARGILEGLLGSSSGWASAPAHEIDARTAVEEAMDRLSVLASLEPAPASAVVRRTIEAALDVPAPRRARAGHGLLVAPVMAAPGLDVDAVAVVGMVEGLVPRPAPESALLPDDARARAGLPTSDVEVDHQHRAVLAALAGGSEHRIVSWSRGDQRRGRARIPSRWLIDMVEPLLGERPTSTWLSGARRDPAVRPWLTVAESYADGLRLAEAPAGLADGELAHAARHVGAGGRIRAHPLVEEPAIAAAIELVEARRSRAFTRFDGNLAGHSVVVDASRPLSPTSMETWATCPRRYLLSRVLGLEDIDKPEAIERLEPADVGTVAHTVLEVVVGEAIAAGAVPAPGEDWPRNVHLRVEELVDAELSELEARGRAGHPRYRSHDRRTLVAALRRALRHDAAVRARHGASPVAVEMEFGTGTDEALVVALDGGRELPFKGYIDRVDRGPGVVSVIDYKTGSDAAFKDLSESDPVQGGRKLQLGIYALAARQRYGDAVARAEYWFTGRARAHARLVGFELGPDQERVLVEVLSRIVAGIEGGVFPARPGEHLYHRGNFESCLYCDFDRLCSPDRAEEWELKRDDPALDDYRTLAEGPDEDGEGLAGE